MYRFRIIPRLLHFKQPAGTSRGTYSTRKIWYILVTDTRLPGQWGVGECAPLPALSCDDLPDYQSILENTCRHIETSGTVDWDALRPFPSITFGLETALLHLEKNSFTLRDTPFSRGERGITINGLIWMGSPASMTRQIEDKLNSGYRCIKFKIGAIGFDEESALLENIRRRFSPEQIELRVDANGAFSPREAPEKLRRLAGLGIHSIEQPIRAGQWEDMAGLVRQTPLPIALDEELIGINDPGQKRLLLDTIRPQYIILKPSLHGGILGCREWISEAERLGIGWWITSALESNIGLNAIAQWTATLGSTLPQGLGTGVLFTDNIPLPLSIRKDGLWYDPAGTPGSFPLKGEFDQTITVDGTTYSQDDMRDISGELAAFLRDWFSDSPETTVQTSGSTGTPKTITVAKTRMTASARATCASLGLSAGDRALLCMPLQYIGSKMMVVRALVAGLNLCPRPPSGHPLKDEEAPFDFAAMTPQQVYNSLQTPVEKARLMQIRRLIIGGGSVSPELERELAGFPNEIHSTYGMTETLSHIALRRLNGANASESYTPLPGVTLSLSERGTLVIHAPSVCDAPLITNDLAKLYPDGSFLIKGRADNTINSGGVKIQIEQLERKLSPLLPFPFVVTSVPDPKLGETVTLLTTQPISPDTLAQIRQTLSKYEHPRHILLVDTIPQTGNGKPDRISCKKLARRIVWDE